MADFCNQCCIELGFPTGIDLAGLSSKQDTEKGLYPIVLCEGCGPIQVDHTGHCVSEDANKKRNLTHQTA